MIDHQILATRLTAVAKSLEHHGALTWQRTSDWTVTGRMPARGERGGGMADGAPDDRIDDRKDDAAAARYHAELTTLTNRMHADAVRLERIIGICCPTPTRNLASRDMLAAQVAADGWCKHCWTNDQTLIPISLQRSGVPYYRDLCRPCGQWRAEHGQLPPLPILQVRHEGRRLTTVAVDKALGRITA